MGRDVRAVAVALALTLLAAACSDSAVPTAAPTTSVDAADEAPAWVDGSSEVLFDQNALHTFELTVSDEALAGIDADPTAEQYVEGSLTFRGETVEPVGIRYKGSIGAFVGCVGGSDLFNPSGPKTCTKLSMKVKINWDDPDRDFYGVRRLQFHAMNLDPSQMHERLGYHLFREMGVAAPRSVHARLVINGEYSGLYALTEQIDGRFTRHNFADGTGNLYKEAWPFASDGSAQDAGVLLDSLRTNEDDDPTATLTTTFADQLLAADNTERSLTEWMNLRATIAHVVVDRAIRHDDGPFHWYCFDGSCEPHNFYWYEEPSGPQLHLIPWDLDNAFENLVSAANPVTPVADALGQITNDCDPFGFGGFQLLQRSATCDPLFAALAEQDVLYQQVEDDLWSGPLAEDAIDELLDAWANQLTAATTEANATHDDAIAVQAWLDEVEALKNALGYVRSRR
ncbi:MAG: CotH kinase family protein [Acidimicrobiia bacterium]|nr:CotH kinase family protein [Acidimicrobiia bacterium]